MLEREAKQLLLHAGDDRAWLLKPSAGTPLLEALRELLPDLVAGRTRRRLVRADDLLSLELTLHGLRVEAGELRRDAARAVLVAHFPPQAVAEETFDDVSLDDLPSPLPANALPAGVRHAGLSRLAVLMPADASAAPYSADGVLDALATWPLALVGPNTLLPGGGWSLAEELRLMTTFLAQALPAERAAPATRIAVRAARRAADVVGHAPSSGAILEAADILRQTVTTAAKALDLDEQQRGALTVQAELTLAEQLATKLEPGVVIDLLPGLVLLHRPAEPPPTATALELPYRLVQSPAANAAFSHARAPVTRDGRTELWHTRLGERARQTGRVTDATDTPDARLAAVWSPDYGNPAGGPEPGFETALTAQDRHEIVTLTSDETAWLPGKRARRYRPVPVRARRLMLTSLGGWLDLEGKWEVRPANDDGLPISLVAWKHHLALGRDWFVETVRIGRLLPLAHRAVSITLTERRFQDAPDGSGRVAVLRNRRFIEVREPLRRYPDPTQPVEGRDFMWRTVEILTHRTPNLLAPGPGESAESFWPRIQLPAGAQDFRFDIRATDGGGAASRYDLPLRFVSDGAAPEPAMTQYEGPDQAVEGRTVARLRSQPVLLAPPAHRVDAAGAPDPGDVVYPLEQVRFGTAAPTATPPAGSPLPRWHPRVRTLHIISTSLQQLTGDATAGEMAFADVYRLNGFEGANKAEILLSATGAAPMSADFATRSSSDKAGGIVTPNFGVSGTSRAFGLVGGDVDLLAGGTFDPGDFFPSAKVFGGIDLKDILAPVLVVLGGAVVPKLKTTRTKEKIETVFEHRVESVPNSVPLLRMNERGTSKLDIKASLTAYFKVEDPSIGPIGSGPGGAGGNPPGLKEPEADAEAKLTWFKLNFFGCVIVSFDAFTFKVSAKEGVKPDPKIASENGVVFGGPLAFVDSLRHRLSGSRNGDGSTPAGGGGGGGGGGGSGTPGFEVTPIFKPELTGITVGTKLGLSKLPMGVFTLKNLMVSAAVRLPFDGKPLSLQLGFAERSNPFQLTVSLFGGGGFVVITLDTEEPVRELEAALEFGAFAELDFGVASGAIYVKAGIYIYFNAPEEQTTLKGYVEMGGEVQVLGIISVSITLHLSLGYYKVGAVAEVRGQATLAIEIEILFFSASVNLTVERRFGGTEADPTFADLIPGSDVWTEYAEAFA